MIIVAKKKTVFIVILILVIAAIGISVGFATAANAMPSQKTVILIDPGHGGVDNGVVGKAGTKESDFNLLMSKELQTFLEEAGFEVKLTRENEGGLYGDSMDNFKRRDMAARKQIVDDVSPDLLISIHANKFPDKSRRGAQVFFDSLNDGGRCLAEGIQSGLNTVNMKYTERSYSALSGDYFMLKCTRNPSVIVECGFISNAEDEELLNSIDYRNELAFAVYSGVIGYMETL